MYCKSGRSASLSQSDISINSSKVYCKCHFVFFVVKFNFVLIVAKCIVNPLVILIFQYKLLVLIVAKCIVNNLLSSRNSPIHVVLIVAKCIVNIKQV